MNVISSDSQSDLGSLWTSGVTKTLWKHSQSRLGIDWLLKPRCMAATDKSQRLTANSCHKQFEAWVGQKHHRDLIWKRDLGASRKMWYDQNGVCYKCWTTVLHTYYKSGKHKIRLDLTCQLSKINELNWKTEKEVL